LYLVSKAVGFRVSTKSWASFLIFSHRGMLQHRRQRHCVPQYSLAPKHWQYSLRHRVRLQVHPTLCTSSRCVDSIWEGDVAPSRSSSSRLLFFPPLRLEGWIGVWLAGGYSRWSAPAAATGATPPEAGDDPTPGTGGCGAGCMCG
jgi:hypothetical protein